MASNSDLGSEEFETLSSTSDVELLKRAWRNEKAAPEILQYEGALVQRVKGQIELVVNCLNPSIFFCIVFFIQFYDESQFL